ncbi:MAG: hypothetical protein BECKG1743F_GA0114225_110823 [Candidatus Kentron sp. G]|nr:MAG: hypothetical protein BECKG1743F_GA0114225_110823 [Candidatus Kentron sp. G]
MKVCATGRFNRIVKKLAPNIKAALDSAVRIIVTSFEIRGTLSHDQAWVPDGAHGRS